MMDQLADMQQAITAFGEHYRYDVGYLHKLLRGSPGGYRVFDAFRPMAAYRKTLPAEAYYVARIEAMRSEDCGPCLQLALDMAREEGVSAEVLRAAWEGEAFDEERLDDVRSFSRMVAENRPYDDVVAQRVAERYGEEGVAELAICIASSRVFPTLKRALGEARSCSRVEVRV